MQAAFAGQQQEMVNLQRTELVQHRAKSQQLLVEVCDRSGNQTKVFGDIVLYILHETGLYNSSNKEVVQKETLTALESVIPRQSISSFMVQADVEKVKQLDELWKIVWGIRLFNREMQKGGAGIQDVPGDLSNMIQSAQSIIKQQLDQTDAALNNYLVCLTTDVVPEADVPRIVDEYINRQQYHQFLNHLAELVRTMSNNLAVVQPMYAAIIEEIKGMVTSTTSVPKSTIYPKFIEASEKWERFKVLLADMRGYKRILDTLLQYQNSFTQKLKPGMVEEGLRAEANAKRPPPDQVALQQAVNPAGQTNPCLYTPMLPGDTTVEFNGFCIVSMIQSQILRPIAPEVGYVKLMEKYYGFADEKALQSFVVHPHPFLHATVRNQNLARKAVLLLLDLGDEMPTELYYEGTRQKLSGLVVIQKQDADTQTGQIDPYKDYKYQWNEWELRRLALKLADLRNKRTHSCQTDESHFKRDNEAQTYPKKQAGSQTLTEQSTQSKSTARYIAGLRGDPESKVKVVSIEID
eukprot:EG_transcript_7617